MTYNRLKDNRFAGLKLASLSRRRLDGCKWHQAEESILNKRYCHRKVRRGRHTETAPAQNSYIALSAWRHWLTTASQLNRDLSAVSGTRISRQTVYSHLAETGLFTRRPVRKTGYE
ncbi:hypothetical protein TNCV_1571681 [Trichonephila clavipes]|uniref:Transposase Tc1-like domain-containing protein n=1 Tax=Trichonephila clavipes TaxID=2585209 RepID=A0A8X6SU64_TRICX|nr:hypothetical protein TNCV_1571681 [Trichonephila clavipes]